MTRIRSPWLRSGLIGWLVGIATQVAFFEPMCVSWPSGENGAEMMRCETPLFAMPATSYTRMPPLLSEAKRYSPRIATQFEGPFVRWSWASARRCLRFPWSANQSG